MVRGFARYIILSVVSVGAILGVVAVNATVSRSKPEEENESTHLLTTTVVSTATIKPEDVAIVERYSGRLEPLEQFTVSFEVGGRLKALGRNEQGKMLDDGMVVRAGQALGQLENRQYKAEVTDAEAQLDEAKAKVEKAEANLARVEDLQKSGSNVITPEEYEERIFSVKESRAKMKMADARLQQAQKRLDDCVIYAPDAGVISKRYVIPGESLNPHEPVFDIVQVSQVLLTVGVPDSDVRRINEGQAVSVSFVGRDARGRSYPARQGKVRYVPPTADATSGLFRVEIVLDNAEGKLRPGLIGLASVTTETVSQAYRIPANAVIFRSERGREVATIFTVTKERPVDAKGVELEEADLFAQEYQLKDWIEQGKEVVVANLPAANREVVVRGQFRLVNGRPVRILAEGDKPSKPPERRPAAIVDKG